MPFGGRFAVGPHQKLQLRTHAQRQTNRKRPGYAEAHPEHRHNRAYPPPAVAADLTQRRRSPRRGGAEALNVAMATVILLDNFYRGA